MTTRAAVRLGALVHPHVERCVLGVGEPPAGIVKLRGGNPEIEEDPLDAAVPGVGGDLGDLVVDRVRDRHPAGIALGEGVPGLNRGGVGVDPDQHQPRNRVEEGSRVAGAAKRGVDEDRRAATGSRAGERGQQEGGNPAGHHRQVRIGVLAH